MKMFVCTLMIIATIIGVYCVHRQYSNEQPIRARLEKDKQIIEERARYLKAKQKVERELETFRKINNIKTN